MSTPRKPSRKPAKLPALDLLKNRYDEVVPPEEKHRREAEEQAGNKLFREKGKHGMLWQGYGECYKCGMGANVQIVKGAGWIVTGDAATKSCTGR